MVVVVVVEWFTFDLEVRGGVQFESCVIIPVPTRLPLGSVQTNVMTRTRVELHCDMTAINSYTLYVTHTHTHMLSFPITS